MLGCSVNLELCEFNFDKIIRNFLPPERRTSYQQRLDVTVSRIALRSLPAVLSVLVSIDLFALKFVAGDKLPVLLLPNANS